MKQIMNIKIYTTSHCPYCTATKQLLADRGLKYEIIDLENNPELWAKLAEENNYRTVPKIFIDGKFVGGFNELQNLDQSGNL